MQNQLAKELAEAFLRWPLPDSVCADLCATKQGPGRVGTNLLSYTEAEQMVREVVAPKVHEAEFKAQWYPVAELAPPELQTVLFAWVRGKGNDHTMRTGTWSERRGFKPSGPNDHWRSKPTHWRELPVLNVV